MFKRFVVGLITAVIVLGGMFGSGYPAVTAVYAEDSVQISDMSTVIPDGKLCQVLQILTNYQKSTEKNFYDTMTASGTDPYTVDITTLPQAAQYNKAISQSELEAFTGTVNLAPYGNLTSLEGLNYAKRVSEVVLPATVIQGELLVPLSVIPGKTFYEMTRLDRVVMPETVAAIGDSAFEKCDNLTSINVYKADSGPEAASSDKALELQNVVTIGIAAFASCTSVTDVTLYTGQQGETTDPVFAISSNAFNSCTALTSIVVPYASLGTGIFTSCLNLQNIVFNDSITHIPDNTLTNAGQYSGGMKVHFPAKLASIGAYACDSAIISEYNLDQCRNLIKIEEYAFHDASLGTVCVLDLSAAANLQTICHSAFAGTILAGSTTVSLPDSINAMGAGVFAGCNMTAVNIPKSLPQIPDGMFLACYSLETVTVPKSSVTTAIGDHAFDLCGHLSGIGFLNNMEDLEVIGDYAFARCIPQNADIEEFGDTLGLRTVTIPDSVTQIGASAFENDFLISTINTGKNITEIPDRFMICEDSKSPSWEDVVLDDPITGGAVTYAFRSGIFNVVDVEHDSVVTYALRSDSNHISLKNTYSGYSDTFKNLSNLNYVTLSENVTSIGDYAFFGNSHLNGLNYYKTDHAVVMLPTALKTLGKYAFARCSYQQGTARNEGTLVIDGIEYVVFQGAVDIGEYAFNNDFSLNAVNLSGNIVSIPAHCFDSCGYNDRYDNEDHYYGLTVISDILGVKAIKDYAFNKCYNLEYAVDVNKMDEYAFYSPQALEPEAAGNNSYVNYIEFGSDLGLPTAGPNDTTVDNSVLGKYSFAETAIRRASTLSASRITKIDSNAFDNCRNLEMVYCPDTLTSIEANAFRNCPLLNRINFPVYASLSATMIAKNYDTETSLTLTPTLGNLRNSVLAIPTGYTVTLPATAFARRTSEKIAQINSKGVEETDVTNFSVVYNEKTKLYEITGGDTEVRGGAVRISVQIPFNDSYARTMSIDIPADVVNVHADEDTIAFTPNSFKIDNSGAGVAIKEDEDEQIIYIDRKKAGHNLTLAAEAQADLTNEVEATIGSIKGMITDPAKWEVVSGDALSFKNDSVTMTTGADICTTSAVFDIKEGTEALVRVYFDDGTDTPPAKTLKIELVDPIDRIDYSIDSIGTAYMNPGSLTMPAGQTDQISVAPEYSDEDDQRDYVIYSSNKEDIVTVDNGAITAHKAGTARITIGTATNSTYETIDITVKEAGEVIEPVYVEVSGDMTADKKGLVYVDETTEFEAVCLPSYASQGVSWILSDETTCQMEADESKAVLRGVNPNATVTLTATALNNSRATEKLSVSVMARTTELEFKFEDDPVEIEAEKVMSMVMSSDQNQTSGIIRKPDTSWQDVTFTSSDTSVLTLGTTANNCGEDPVTLSGKSGTLYYTGLKEGTATITAQTEDGVTAALKVKVISRPITQITFKDTEITMVPGGQTKTVITTVPAETSETVAYESSDTNVATVSDSGVITAVSAGTAKITVSSRIKDGVSAECTVTVIKSGSSFTVNGNTYKLNSNNTLTMTAASSSVMSVRIPSTVNIGGTVCKVTGITSTAFAGMISVTQVSLGSNITSIPAGAFRNCTSLRTITIGGHIKKIGANAFANCISLKSVSMGSGVLTIGAGAFANCSSLANVSMSSTISSIGKNAFKNCSALTSVTIGAGVKTIGNNAFANCSRLNKVIIGKSVKTIGKNAFKNCKVLKTVNIKSKKITTIKKGAFKTIRKGAVIKCPKAKLKKYKKLLKKSGLAKNVKVKK